MKKLLNILALCAGAALLPAHAQDFKQGDVEVSSPYARATVAGVKNGAVWFSVKNSGKAADRVVGAKTDVAGHTEIHDMKMEGDVMHMFQIEGIDVAAGQSITLGEGNKLHVMLMNLKEPLKEGDKFKMTVQFQQAGEVPIEVVVKDMKAGMHGHRMEHKEHKH